MNRKLFIFITVLALVSLACALPFMGDGAGGDSGSQAGSGDTQNGGTGGTGGNTGSSSNGSGTTTDSGSAGPDALAFTDSVFNFASEGNYTQNITITYQGVDTSGNPLTYDMEMKTEIQNQPTFAMRTEIFGAPVGGATEAFTMIVVGDTAYSSSEEMGCFSYPYDPTTDEYSADVLFEDARPTGEIKLVEKGVEVNGLVTDKYEVTKENFEDPAEDDTFTYEEGFVYITRAGQYVTRMEMKGKGPAQMEGFDDTQDADINFVFDFFPVEGELGITAPEGCGAAQSDYPMLDDATDVFSMAGGLFYNSSHTFDEAMTFYREQMPAAGWTQTIDDVFSTIGTLEYTKDGKTVNISILGSDTGVMVTITEQ